MEGVAGQFLGADVDALEKLASQMKRATELAQNLVSSLTNMINELNFFGRFGEEFASLIIGVTAPLITKIVGSLTKVGGDLHIAAQKQKQVSDGAGKPTPAGVDKTVKQPGATGAGTKPQKHKSPPPASLGGTYPERKYPADGNSRLYTDYPNGERRVGGTRAWRNNNPGNIRWSDGDTFARDHGAIGRQWGGEKYGWMAVFPDEETGRRAQEALLQGKTYRDKSIADAIGKYAPVKDANNVEAYVKAVTKESGLDRNSTIASLSQDEFNKMVQAMRNHEKTTPGHIEQLPK
jgi:hypothetical protein